MHYYLHVSGGLKDKVILPTGGKAKKFQCFNVSPCEWWVERKLLKRRLDLSSTSIKSLVFIVLKEFYSKIVFGVV